LTQRYIHFHRYSMGSEEKKAILDTLDSGWITKGPKVTAFEAQINNYIGSHHALALNSCTAGLHLALMALGIGPGDEVITTPLTFIATVNMIHFVGATPVLADVNPKTLNIDVKEIERKITPKTKAIIPVHLAGQPCDLSPIIELAKKHQVYVVDDAAHAIGASYRGKKIGLWCDATAFSFYATKNITTGEGGMLLTPHKALIEKARPMSLHGLSKDAWKRYSTDGFQHYLVEQPGFKYNMTDLQAALGIEQLKKCNKFIQQRRDCVNYYRKQLEDLPVSFQEPISEIEHAYHLFQIILDPDQINLGRDELLHRLQLAGIGCAVHFIPIHQHPFYQKTLTYSPSDLPHSTHLGENLISLPLYPDLTRVDQDYIIEVLSDLINKHRK